MPNSTPEKKRLLHKEAFCLMWYACNLCSHRERFWNSRDGVTPFCTACPTCGGPTLMHVQFHLDHYEPEHKPHHGQRVWIDMTRERAKAIAKARVAAWAGTFAAAGRLTGTREQHEKALEDSFFEHGEPAPDMRIEGYTLAP